MTIKRLKSNDLLSRPDQRGLFSPRADELSASTLTNGLHLEQRAATTAHNRASALLQQYFVKEHHASRPHFDLRFANNRTLASWAIPDGPSLCPLYRRRAIQMNDHLKKNVDFEGVFPEGKPGAGPTMLWDNGFYAPLPGYSNIEECFQRGYFRFTIYGKKLQGNWTLTWAEETRCSQYGSVWYLIKDDDAYARTASAPAITIASPLSVNLGLTLQQVKSKFLAGKAKHPPQSVTLFDI